MEIASEKKKAILTKKYFNWLTLKYIWNHKEKNEFCKSDSGISYIFKDVQLKNFQNISETFEKTFFKAILGTAVALKPRFMIPNFVIFSHD